MWQTLRSSSTMLMKGQLRLRSTHRPSAILHGVDQPSLGGQQVDELPEPVGRPLGGDLVVVVAGQCAADPFEDLREPSSSPPTSRIARQMAGTTSR